MLILWLLFIDGVYLNFKNNVIIIRGVDLGFEVNGGC